MGVVPDPTNFFSVDDISALQATAEASEEFKWAGCCHKDTSGVWLDAPLYIPFPRKIITLSHSHNLVNK